MRCSRCGRLGHIEGECFAKRAIDGSPLPSQQVYASAFKPKTDRPTGCFRCGRESHWVATCFASTHVDGHYLGPNEQLIVMEEAEEKKIYEEDMTIVDEFCRTRGEIIDRFKKKVLVTTCDIKDNSHAGFQYESKMIRKLCKFTDLLSNPTPETIRQRLSTAHI